MVRTKTKTTLFLLLLLCFTADAWWRRRHRPRPSPPPEDTTKPTFSNCLSGWTKYVLSTPATVRWTEPTARDNRRMRYLNGGCPDGPQNCDYSSFEEIDEYAVTPSRSGPEPGSAFTEGRHSIVYTARDLAGNTARCTISFTVQIIRCPEIGASPQRSVTCPGGNKVDSTCKFSCATGYSVRGSSSVRCMSPFFGDPPPYNTAYWSSSFPTCEIRVCSAPPTPIYGSKSCPSFNYWARCTFRCNSGYRLSGSSSRTCTGSSWSGTAPSCRDVQPPIFSRCPSDIVVTNNDRVSSAVVSYSTPRASDNSRRTASISKTSGQYSGTTFSSGRHYIRYRATDSSGNTAYCSFHVTVRVVSCSSIQYQHGRRASCPHETLKGATCTFTCNIGFTMSGTASTFCDGNGDWNRGFPNCYGVTCPQLSTPSSGSISPCSRSFGSRCTFSCNTGYELVGSSSRQCSHRAGQSVGFWTGSQPRCQIKTCPYPSVSGGLRAVTRSTCQVSSSNTVNYNSVCEYTCDTGYRMTGNHLRTCGPSGSWTQPLPVCQVITCALNSLPVPSNGVRTGCTGSSVSFGDFCSLSCNRGYRPTSSTRRTCQDNGSGQGVWSGGTITCSVVNCNPLLAPAQGQIIACRRGSSSTPVTNSQPFDTICTISCDTGYTLISGSSSRTCLISGQWDGQQTVCADVTPPNLQCPGDVTVYADPGQTTGSPTWEWEPLVSSDASGSYTAYLTAVDEEPVSSKPSSFNEGTHSLTYSVTDSSGNSVFCSFDVTIQVVRCPPVEAPNKAAITGDGCSTTSSAIRGTSCRFICNRGYERTSGDPARTCTQGGNNPSQGLWSGTQLLCSAVQCLVPTLNNGFINGCGARFISYQENCQFRCDFGYRTPNGEFSRTRTCQANRRWSGMPFECSVPITCPPLQVPSHGTVRPTDCSSTNRPYGSACQFSCNDGYDLSGPREVLCSDSGSWSDLSPTSCTDTEEPVFEERCPQNIEKIADRGQNSWTGQMKAPSATDNSGQVTVQRLRGASSSTYPEGRTSGVFRAVDLLGNEAFCTVHLDVKVKRCRSLVHPPDGYVESCSNLYGSTCKITCDTGYELSSRSAERTCELDSNIEPFWSGSDAVCTIRRCPLLVPPNNSHTMKCGGTPENLSTFGSRCSFYCPHGYSPRGEDTVECMADGSWSGTSFVCEVITCPSLELPGVNVEPSECQGTPQYRQQCTFSCPQGLTISPIISAQVTCLGNGEWSGATQDIKCKDTTPPIFDSCPTKEHLKFFTDATTGKCRVNWSVSAIDSSSVPPTITCEPERGSLLEAGQYIVTCVARDASNNEGRCVFNIRVKVRTCPPLSPPFSGKFLGLCSNVEGATCTVTCNDGYRLVGSSVANCQTVNRETKWIRASSPHCEAITCNSLPSFDERGEIHPSFCLGSSQPFIGAVCDIRCKDRYTLVKNPIDAPSFVECLQDGSWNYVISDTYTCLDQVIPEISHCPPPVRFNRNDISKPVTVHFDLPLAVDNSAEDIQPVLTPSLIPPFDVSQSTTINCLFEDSAGNQNDQCQIEIIVIDDVPPVLVRPCPSDQEITARTNQIEVFWTEPLFEDPGGKHVIVSSNYDSGAKFGVGSYAVRYTAINENTGRTAECLFNVDVQLENCLPLETPANGALACHDTTESQVCVLSCLPGFGTTPLQPTTFVCNAKGKWQSSRVADCGVQHRPSPSKLFVRASYGANDCNKADQAPMMAVAFLNKLLMTRFPVLCSDLNGCSVDDIKVTCGPVNTRRSRGRDRRQSEGSENFAWTFELHISVDIEHNETLSDDDAVQFSNITLHSLADEVESFLPPTVEFPETVGGNTTIVPDSVEIETVLLNCNEGFTPDLHSSWCVACVAGTFFRESEKDCHPCPVGRYQDEERQAECKLCPAGTSTNGEGAKGRDECHKLCPPGTYSADGLFSCQKCEIGFYQPALGQATCLRCPFDLKTPLLGTINRSECKGLCAAGTYSLSGLEPCTPCAQRYFQPNPGQRFCLICDGRKTTEGVGSNNQSQCIDIHHCTSEPCQNGGTCRDLFQGYTCNCPAGFQGQDCEVNIDECEGQPCKNKGTCVDGTNSFQCFCTVGFEGLDCTINVNECGSEPCANGGTCEDGLGYFFCHCPPTFEGPLCEREKDACSSNPCFNNGTCERLGWDYDCLCPVGFMGTNCSTQVSACSLSPCRNGNCSGSEDGYYTCLCNRGFTGENCDIPINFCAALVCDNGGFCIQTTEGATCICPPEFAGYYDETCQLLDTCTDSPCMNGGNCHHYENLVSKCECLPGYSGDHCEVDINECASFPCMNFASCEDKINGYICTCLSGFTGENCEIFKDDIEDGSGSYLYIIEEDQTEYGSGSGFGITYYDETEDGSGDDLDIFEQDIAEHGSGRESILQEDLSESSSYSYTV